MDEIEIDPTIIGLHVPIYYRAADEMRIPSMQYWALDVLHDSNALATGPLCVI